MRSRTARVVSGVGGQYNFVAMAHALPEARSILCLRATRTAHGTTTSNIVWSYAHATIPRHLRDIVVTEYGIADLRGKTDREVVEGLIAIMDARFVDSFVAAAKRAGKLPKSYRVSDLARGNTPERLAEKFRPWRRAADCLRNCRSASISQPKSSCSPRRCALQAFDPVLAGSRVDTARRTVKWIAGPRRPAVSGAHGTRSCRFLIAGNTTPAVDDRSAQVLQTG